MKKITAAQANKILKRLGLEAGGADDGITFYATNDEETEVYTFDTKRERDEFLSRKRGA